MIAVQSLRKIFSTQGVKGFGSANRAAFTAAIEAAEVEAYDEDAARIAEMESLELELEGEAAHEALVEAEAAPVKVSAKKAKLVAPKLAFVSLGLDVAGKCMDCGRNEDFRASRLCEPCREYAEAENGHSDENHAETPDETCPVCRPELDRRTNVASRPSRIGMEIVAKGTEIHKSETFRVAAEAAGWKVSILGYVTEEEGDDVTRYVAKAAKGENQIELAWEGRAYDYAASSAQLDGKARKVRNLKEALRFL